MAAKELRTSTCVDDLQSLANDVTVNAQTQNENNTNIFNLLDDGSVTDTYKVLVSGSDVLPDYLHAKIEDHGAFNVDYDIPVSAEDAGDAVKLYWSSSSVAGFSGTGTLFLTLDNGVLQFTEFTDTVDTFTVAVSAADTTPSYLNAAFNSALTGAYVGGADLLIGTYIANPAADETVQPYVDVSTISGFNASGTFYLALVNNVSTYVAASTIVSSGITPGYALDASGSTVSFDPTEITGFTSEFQFYMHLSTASTATDPAWKSVTGYDATKKQIQWHQSGAFSFNDVTNYDTGTAQYLGHINGAWQFLGIPRFAITTEAIPAAAGNYTSGNITPGKTNNASNILLFDFGATYGAAATRGAAAKCENYMFSAVAIHKPIIVYERATGIYVIPTEGCLVVPAS